MVSPAYPTRTQIAKIVSAPMSENPGLCFAVGCVINGQGLEPTAFYFPDVDQAKTQNQFDQYVGVGPNSQFLLASITKTFTATAYVNDLPGTMDESISTFNPNFPLPVPLQALTLGSLVNYQSGLPQDNSDYMDDQYDKPTPYSSTAMLDYLSSGLLQLPAMPSGGYGYSYSNLAFAIMGSVLKAQNQNSLMASYNKLFVNFGMSSTLLFKKASLANVPRLFSYDGSQKFQKVNMQYKFLPAYNAGGGLVSTVPDMTTWLQYNMGSFIGVPGTQSALNPLLALTQTATTKIKTGKGASLGLGWFIVPAVGSTPAYVCKDGDLPGVRTYMMFSASSNPGWSPSDCGVFVLCNASGLQLNINKVQYDLVKYLAKYIWTIMINGGVQAEELPHLDLSEE